MSTLRALGGGELRGDRLVRFVYLDETGTGDPAKDTFVIVAGVIVHADKQWKAVEARLRQLADEFALPEHREGFIFHAVEMYNGGKIVARDRYPKELRHEYLLKLCRVPEQLGLPVVMCPVSRKDLLAADPAVTQSNVVQIAQSIAAQGCAFAVEQFMREDAEPGEVATMVYEQAGELSKHIRANHNWMQSAACAAVIQIEEWKRFLPLERIVDTAHFAGKSDTSILQLADACAFALRRKMEDLPDWERFYEPLDCQLVFKPRVWCD